MTDQRSAAPARVPAIAWPRVQQRLGVVADGHFGPVSYAALLPRIAGHDVPIARELGAAIAAHVTAYEVDASADRLAGFLGQSAHESWGFTKLSETWGPTSAQLGYEGRRDLGNTKPGDGRRYLGRGLIDITGRGNYAVFGSILKLDLIGHPELAERPDVAVLTALEFWRRHDLNAVADRRDWRAMTHTINGGFNGFVERVQLIGRALAVLT